MNGIITMKTFEQFFKEVKEEAALSYGRNPYLENVFKSIEITPFVPEENYEEDYWYKQHQIIRGEQKIIVKTVSPTSYYAIREFTNALCSIVNHPLITPHEHSCKPGDMDFFIETNGPKGLKLVYSFYQQVLDVVKTNESSKDKTDNTSTQI